RIAVEPGQCIQRAIDAVDAGGTVFLKEGDHRVDESLLLRSHLRLVGNANGRSRLVLAGGVHRNMLAQAEATITDIVLHDLAEIVAMMVKVGCRPGRSRRNQLRVTAISKRGALRNQPEEKRPARDRGIQASAAPTLHHGAVSIGALCSGLEAGKSDEAGGNWSRNQALRASPTYMPIAPMSAASRPSAHKGAVAPDKVLALWHEVGSPAGPPPHAHLLAVLRAPRRSVSGPPAPLRGRLPVKNLVLLLGKNTPAGGIRRIRKRRRLRDCRTAQLGIDPSSPST
ncbi:MAG: hypothetical protein AAGC92_16520, partial [Pseudomonadota bacterium]